MTDKLITDLTAASSPLRTDVLPTMAAAGSSAVKMTVAQLLDLIEAGDIPALAIAGITGLQAALDLKANEADLGALATEDDITASLVTDFGAAADARIAAALLDALSDVVITAAASGDYLRHNGTNWVDSPIQAGDIPDLSGTYATQANLSANETADRARANHTGTQAAATISDFAAAADARIAAASVDALADVVVTTPAARHILAYDDGDARWENRAIEAADLPDLSGTYATTGALATNQTNDRARANHTGTQLATTISDFAAAVAALLAAASLADLGTRSASDLSSGTLPDARFPATLPAANGSALTALNASNLGSGTVPDARFPATLPAVSGANLTGLNASNLASGTVPSARLATDTLAVFLPQANEPPATNFATFDTRNGHPVLDFDDTTQEAAVFSGVLKRSYRGGGVTVYVHAALTSATTGTLGWDVAFERIGAAQQDMDADGFASAKTITAATVPGTSGHVLILSVAFADGAEMDSLAVGEMFRLRVRRDVANDTATGDAELRAVEIVG